MNLQIVSYKLNWRPISRQTLEHAVTPRKHTERQTYIQKPEKSSNICHWWSSSPYLYSNYFCTVKTCDIASYIHTYTVCRQWQRFILSIIEPSKYLRAITHIPAYPRSQPAEQTSDAGRCHDLSRTIETAWVFPRGESLQIGFHRVNWMSRNLWHMKENVSRGVTVFLRWHVSFENNQEVVGIMRFGRCHATEYKPCPFLLSQGTLGKWGAWNMRAGWWLRKITLRFTPTSPWRRVVGSFPLVGHASWMLLSVGPT